MSQPTANNIYEFWFPRKTTEIIIVTSQEPEEKKSVDAFTTSETYSFLDNVGDKDALLDTGMFLSRHYPKARIKRLFPREFNDRDDSASNLVVIGGPINNSLCKRLMSEIESQVAYSPSTGSMRVSGVEYECVHDDTKGMQKDYGYFATFANRLNKANRVVLTSGITTFGVVGAFRAFSDPVLSKLNFETIRSLTGQGQSIAFECYFEVPVHNCELRDCTKVLVDYPIVLANQVFGISAEHGKSIRTSPSKVMVGSTDSEAARKSSSRVRDLLDR